MIVSNLEGSEVKRFDCVLTVQNKEPIAWVVVIKWCDCRGHYLHDIEIWDQRTLARVDEKLVDVRTH